MFLDFLLSLTMHGSSPTIAVCGGHNEPRWLCVESEAKWAICHVYDSIISSVLCTVKNKPLSNSESRDFKTGSITPGIPRRTLCHWRLYNSIIQTSMVMCALISEVMLPTGGGGWNCFQYSVCASYLYEGRSINKLQNDIILLICKILKFEIYVL